MHALAFDAVERITVEVVFFLVSVDLKGDGPVIEAYCKSFCKYARINTRGV